MDTKEIQYELNNIIGNYLLEKFCSMDDDQLNELYKEFDWDQLGDYCHIIFLTEKSYREKR